MWKQTGIESPAVALFQTASITRLLHRRICHHPASTPPDLISFINLQPSI
ncbi:hypothetical protein HanRHA438_Chr15g0705991 [Helianthus annuus]|nr:hypothetical protein HanRHA438_Chr15g0705991 [Helianthus annuus]